MKKSTQNRLNDLATAMDGVCPEDLDALLRKDQRISIRVTAHEKAHIQSTATALGLNASEYLAALHAFASPRLAAPKEPLAPKTVRAKGKATKPATLEPVTSVTLECAACEAAEWEQIAPTIWRKRYRSGIGGFTHIHHVGRVFRVDHFDGKESMSTRFEHATAAADAYAAANR